MKKYLFTSLAALSIVFGFSQNYVSGSIGLYGPSWNAATTIPTGGQALVSTAGNWWFGGIVSKRTGTGSLTFDGTGTYSNALLTSYTDGVVNRTGSSADFTFPTGDAGATVGGVYHPLMVSVASGTLTTSAIYNASGTTPNPTLLGAGVGKVDPIANWGFTSAAANATVTLTTRDETGVFGAAGIYVAGLNKTSGVWDKLGTATAIIAGGNTLVSNTTINLNNYSAFTAAGDATGVPVSITVFLQGDISGSTMRNDLQTYGSPLLLPPTSPYGSPTSSYPNINNTGGVIGNVVDWVNVEVRLASTGYSTAAQTKSLILKTDGTLVEVDGTVPVFNAQIGAVRLIIKHRNHVAIMSNDVVVFTGTPITYDFSSSLTQASNQFAGDPAQMKLVGTKWCMWAGDINQDLGIDGTDFNAVANSVKLGTIDSYFAFDLTMDGGVDGNDFTMMNANNKVAPYSTLVNY